MASMARDLKQDSVDATLERITVSATESVDGGDAAGADGGAARSSPL
ncbi:hypothetical protein [Streptomyces sp. NPDC000878]